MTLQLPQPIAAYFTADKSTDKAAPEALANCFTDDAVVKDEGHTHRGRAAIRQWKEETAQKYTYTCEPLACVAQHGRTVVTCRLAGSFSGSPLDLRFMFELAGAKIAALEVAP